MGDRANIVLDQEEGKSIYLYTHWGGNELPETLARSLERTRERWTDEIYLGRLIFQDLTRGSEDSITGFGLSTYVGDNSYPYLRVDAGKQTVTVDFSALRAWNDQKDKPPKVYTFEEFSAFKDLDWKTLGYGDE
jgi:hypothetical protein